MASILFDAILHKCTVDCELVAHSSSALLQVFARELAKGWTSIGNQVLHFQDKQYFVRCESTMPCTLASKEKNEK